MHSYRFGIALASCVWIAFRAKNKLFRINDMAHLAEGVIHLPPSEKLSLALLLFRFSMVQFCRDSTKIQFPDVSLKIWGKN